MLLTLVLASALLFVVYQLAVSKNGPGFDELKKENRFLGRELATIMERHERNKARLVVLQRENEVVRKANRLLREEEAERLAEINRLRSELDFYSKMAGTGGEQVGLAVYQVELNSTQSPLVFQFVLTLTQNIRRASIISGKATLDIEGTLDNRPVTLYWSQLTEGTTAETSFRFKYFQQLEGYLTLPEDFNPTRLIISLSSKDQRKPVNKAFDWQELLIGSIPGSG